jgi:hypothetical protein
MEIAGYDPCRAKPGVVSHPAAGKCDLRMLMLTTIRDALSPTPIRDRGQPPRIDQDGDFRWGVEHGCQSATRVVPSGAEREIPIAASLQKLN